MWFRIEGVKTEFAEEIIFLSLNRFVKRLIYWLILTSAGTSIVSSLYI